MNASYQRLAAEVKALSLALELAVCALRLNTTVSAGGEDEQWPECATDVEVLKLVHNAMVPLLGYGPSIESAVTMLSPHNPNAEAYDQGLLLMRWGNLKFAASLASSTMMQPRDEVA